MKPLDQTRSSVMRPTPDQAPSSHPRATHLHATDVRRGAIDARQVWAQNRFWMETQNLVTKRYGGRRRQHYEAFRLAMKGFEWTLKCLRQYGRGVRNAWAIEVNERELYFENLPASFDGFTLLHISDPHLDGMPGLELEVLRRLEQRAVDLCVMTGDYRSAVHGPIRATMQALERLVGGIESRHGFLAVLGNHDDCHMVAPLERMGIRVLINEAVSLERGGELLQFVGTDDVHYYYTDQALHALECAATGFSIALVHSPELCDAAADAGVALYLCGHTHAGQVCLPGGIPLVKHLRAGRDYYRGHWRHRGMQGITSSGLGTSALPVRFNTRGEVLVLTLRSSRSLPRERTQGDGDED